MASVSERSSSELRAGVKAVAPMLVGVVPFGLVAGATPVARDLGGWVAVGFSTVVFAGASQLAAIDVLTDGGSALVAVVAACTINLRMLLYAASLAPHLAHLPLRARLAAGYLLTDQAYVVSITRFSTESVPPPRRMPYYLGAGLALWVSWQVATVAGVLLGAGLSEDVPLDFAVPLCFLVLLVPAMASKPAMAAAAGGGGGAVLAAELGAGDLSILVGAVAGIATGAVCELLLDRRAPLPLEDST